jgi:5-methylcytosine-specific restriction endonuclease McrA
MKCYDRTGDNNPFWGKRHKDDSVKKMTEHPNRPKFKLGADNPNFVRFGKDSGFEKKPYLNFKERLIKEIGKCERCGIDDRRVLTLHHINRDGNNNERSNLALLCWNCHVIDHYESGDGMYTNMKRKKDRVIDGEPRD